MAQLGCFCLNQAINYIKGASLDATLAHIKATANSALLLNYCQIVA